jgi:hypothetical protein
VSATKPIGERLLDSYEHYQGPSTTGFYLLFAVDKCEVCGAEILAANSVRVRTPDGGRMLRRAHLTPRRPPEEGGWSELHGCTTCGECCYEDMERAS